MHGLWVLACCVRRGQCGCSPDGTQQRWGKELCPWNLLQICSSLCHQQGISSHQSTGNSGLAAQALRFREGWCMLCVTSLQYTDFYARKYSKSWRKLFFGGGWSLEFKELISTHSRNLKKCVQIVASGKVC